MEQVEECDQTSALLLQHVKEAAVDMKEKFSEMQDMFKEDVHSTDGTTDTSARSLRNKVDAMPMHDGTALYDDVVPALKESEFFQNLHTKNGENCSSTPKHSGKPQVVKMQRADAIKNVVVVQTDKDEASNEIWSIDSRPVTFGLSQESSAGDFYQIETVLPAIPHDKERVDCDDFSDGSQSHTVFSVAKLISSLNKQKKKNKALQERVDLLENDLCAANVKLELQQIEGDEKATGRLSSLVEEVYLAQRERESAVLARLKLAVQERDEAVLRAKAFLKDSKLNNENMKNSSLSSCDTNLKELLDAVCEADSGRAAEKHGSLVLDHINKLKEKRDEITVEEMQAVVRERDDAHHKCRLLAAEANACKEKFTGQNAAIDNKSSLSYKGNLLAAEDDRDEALHRLAAAQEEMETLRIYYSLHKSLSGNVRVEQCEQDDAERLVETLRVAHEHNKLQESNNARHEAEIKQLTEKNERLERLVKVLRRKLVFLAQKSAQGVASSSAMINEA